MFFLCFIRQKIQIFSTVISTILSKHILRTSSEKKSNNSAFSNLTQPNNEHKTKNPTGKNSVWQIHLKPGWNENVITIKVQEHPIQQNNFEIYTDTTYFIQTVKKQNQKDKFLLLTFFFTTLPSNTILEQKGSFKCGYLGLQM